MFRRPGPNSDKMTASYWVVRVKNVGSKKSNGRSNWPHIQTDSLGALSYFVYIFFYFAHTSQSNENFAHEMHVETKKNAQKC